MIVGKVSRNIFISLYQCFILYIAVWPYRSTCILLSYQFAAGLSVSLPGNLDLHTPYPWMFVVLFWFTNLHPVNYNRYTCVLSIYWCIRPCVPQSSLCLYPSICASGCRSASAFVSPSWLPIIETSLIPLQVCHNIKSYSKWTHFKRNSKQWSNIRLSASKRKVLPFWPKKLFQDSFV